MRIRDLISLTVFTLIIVSVIGYIGSFGIRIAPPQNRINLAMVVKDINGIVVDSNVLLRGVPAGKVTAIDSSVDAATIHFYVDGEHRIPVDTDVRLANLSALGETYIDLRPRAVDGPWLQNGAHIATEKIAQPPSISDLAAAVVRVLNQLGPAELEQIVDEVDTALPDPEAVLPNLSRSSLMLRKTVGGLQGRGAELLSNLQTLLQNADFVGPTLAAIAPYFPKIATSLRSQYGGFVTIILDGSPFHLEQFKKYLDRVQNFLDTRAPDIKVLTEALLPKVNGVVGALMNFDTGQVLSNVLAAMPEEGAVTLRVAIPPS